MELVEAGFEMNSSLYLAHSADSEDPVLDLEVRSVISSDQNMELSLILRGWMQAGASAEQLPQFATFEELLDVVTCAVARQKGN